MKYYTIDLYTGKAEEISEKEFRARKVGMGSAIAGTAGVSTWRGEEEILMRIG